MIILTFIFAFFALLSLIGQIKYGINWHPFYFKENTYYFAFEFLLNTTLAMAFYLTSKEEEKDEGIDLFEDDENLEKKAREKKTEIVSENPNPNSNEF